ncbi:hypothetical protein MPH_12944 [Macrophomina phaseolina MS6]|uniref:Uncharacterized protein n=1 Tax=Macrophomina phaseolina (strain MS6) TaxID=1126212 RepID=K2RAS5_MACPH|nr:hypothetical protein MPH_12944 [Macrophomina phaseolina MS6]
MNRRLAPQAELSLTLSQKLPLPFLAPALLQACINQQKMEYVKMGDIRSVDSTNGQRGRMHARDPNGSVSCQAWISLPATRSPRPYAKQSIDRYDQRRQLSSVSIPRAEPDGSTICADIWTSCKQAVERMLLCLVDCVTDEREPHWSEYEPGP